MAVQDAPAAYVSLTTWSDLDDALWRKVVSFITMNDSVMVSGTCYGMLECITNLEPWDISWRNGWTRDTDLIRQRGTPSDGCLSG